MNDALKTGLGFGITSAIITTLGLIVGLDVATNSKLAVIGGIITIAIADAMSDSLGIHISQEFSQKNKKQIWFSTLYTFLAKFFVAILFIGPIIIFNLKIGVIINIILGLLLLSIFSFFVAKNNKENVIHAIFEHISIAILVIIITYFVGFFVNIIFV